jgi:hypothetical protein
MLCHHCPSPHRSRRPSMAPFGHHQPGTVRDGTRTRVSCPSRRERAWRHTRAHTHTHTHTHTHKHTHTHAHTHTHTHSHKHTHTHTHTHRYLFETLPNFRCHGDPVRFSAALNVSSTKKVTVSNPSKEVVNYKPLLLGSNSFKLSCDTFKVRICALQFSRSHQCKHHPPATTTNTITTTTTTTTTAIYN